MRKLSIITLALAALSSRAFSAPFTAGNVVVSRVGNGAAALSSAATVLFLDEYTPGGALVQSLSVPTSVSGANRRLLNSGSATSEGTLLRSTDGAWLTFAGYDADAGTASVVGTTAAATNRVIGRVGPDGNIDTTTALNDAYSTNNIRSAISTNGTDIWLGGTGAAGTNGVRYTTYGSSTSTQLSTDVTNIRVVGIYNGQLYVSTMSGTYRGINIVGSGLPTGSGNIISLLTGFDPSNTSPQSAYGFYFSDPNTLYLGDDRTLLAGGGIQKWTFDGSIWTKQYTLTTGLTAGCRQLTGTTVLGITTLYAVHASTQTQLVSVIDSGAGSAFTTIAASATNTAFRGVAFAPQTASTTEGVDSYEVTEGFEISGDLNSLTASDDNYLCVFPSDASLLAQIVFFGSTAVTNPSALSFTLEYNVQRPGLSYSLDLRRYSNGQWVNKAGGVATTADSTQVAAVTTGANEYISANGDLAARVTWGPVNDEDPSQDGWNHCVDVAKWTLVP